MEHLLKILFFIIFFIFLKNKPKNYDKKRKNIMFIQSLIIPLILGILILRKKGI